MIKHIFFVALLIFSFSSPVNAQSSFTAEIDSSYEALENNIIEVKHSVIINNNQELTTPDIIEIPIVGVNPRNVGASLQDNGQINASANSSGNIEVAIDGAFSGGPGQWSFTVEYQSELSLSQGSFISVSIPPIDIDIDIKRQSMNFSIDTDLSLEVRGFSPIEIDEVLGKTFVTAVNNEGALNKSITITSGSNRTYQINYDEVIRNDSLWWKTFTYVLPGDSVQQLLEIQRVEPQPSDIELDEDGNVYVSYRLRPFASEFVTINAVAKTIAISEGFSDSLSVADETIIETFLNSPTADTGTLTKNPSETIGDFVLRIAAQRFPSSSSIVNYDQNLDNLRSIASELTTNSVPARLLSGFIAFDGANVLETPARHAWLEVFDNGNGWVIYDPVLYSDAKSDLFRVATRVEALSEGPVAEENEESTPSIEILDEEATSAELKEIVDDLAGEPFASGVKNVIIPFLFSIDTYSLTGSAGYVTDNNALRISTEEDFLGSIAPFQKSSIRSSSIFGDTISGDDFEYGVSAAEGQFSSLGTGNTAISYKPFIIIATIGGLISGLSYFMRRNR